MKKVVFICTGNTCRSPMAAAIFQRLRPDVEAASAGLSAAGGEPANANAVAAMAEMGLDIAGHRARRFSPEMARGALVVAMTRGQAELLRRMCPQVQVETLGEDIADPFGGGMARYREAARQIERGARALAARLSRGGGESDASPPV